MTSLRFKQGMSAHWENLSDPLLAHAANRPDWPAVIDGPTILTYRALAELVAKTSVYLHDIGIGIGDRVGVNLSSGVDHVVLMLGLLRAGATLTEIHYSSATRPDSGWLQRLGIAKLFIEAVAPAPPGIASVRVDAGWRALVERRTGDHRAAAKAEQLQILTLSSGSTGTPRAVVATHRMIFDRNLVYENVFATAIHSPDNPANFLLTASIANSAFFRRLLAQLTCGGPVVLLPEYAHPIDFIKAVAAWDNAALAATANMCRAFLAAAPAEGLLLPRVRALISAGTPLHAAEKRAIVQRVTPNFYDNYGTSAIGTISCLRPHETEAKAGTVGRPVANIEVEIVDASGAPCPNGVVGRVRCRSAASAKEFFSLGEMDETERIEGGWYYPGELGHFDADGYLSLRGRAAELIRRSGIELFPGDIEDVIARFPGVREAAALGVPSPRVGEELVAVVVASAGTNREDLAKHCRANLTPEKWPDRILFADTLPKLPGGKPDRLRLRDIVLEKMAPPGPTAPEQR